MVGSDKKPTADSVLASEIRNLKPGESKTTKLNVDDRVIARVTDGIYRQPSSALRELISNAYDANATRVIVHTDAPRFERIVIRDNGDGMSPDVVAYLVNHIGGSSKRTYKGKELGTVSQDDVFQSRTHRRLIGKIGIGLFAVSQLTQHFQIITKQKGDSFRTSAIVVLKTHSESQLAEGDENARFETGTVTFSQEPTTEIEAHGTDIVLKDLRKVTKDGLGSIDRWLALENEDESFVDERLQLGNVGRPIFHIGRVDPINRDVLIFPPELPWDDQDSPAERFRKLYKAISGEVGKTAFNPIIENILDNYLKMLWDISLAVPVEYIDKHPFSISSRDNIDLYQISNEKKGQVKELTLADGENIADKFKMDSSAPDPAGGFQVIVDGVELFHPITIDSTLHPQKQGLAQKRPILFVGKCITPFAKVADDIGGGPLEFEAYFYWNKLIVPKENNGVLIRVNNASGTLFDETFLDYRVSELTRLKQIMAEVYVTRGLDPALNIDRESFNSSHPHYQYIKDWIHRALRQATNRLKAISKDALEERKNIRAKSSRDALVEHVDIVWSKLHGDDIPPPEIEVVDSFNLIEEAERQQGALIIEHSVRAPLSASQTERSRYVEVETARVKALVGVLVAYGVTENMSYLRLQSLIQDIETIYNSERG